MTPLLRPFAAACLGLALLPRMTTGVAAAESKPAAAFGPTCRLVNLTGKFADQEVFWSLDHGKEWHSFADRPTVPCPLGNGRLYFRLGAAPKHFNDRDALWDFIEYASEDSRSWHGNTTYVDAFCIPITIAMGGKEVGIRKSRSAVFNEFRAKAPTPFQACVKGDWWIVAPCAADLGQDGASSTYFDAYINEVWAMYAEERPTPSGKWSGKVKDGALTFTPVGPGQPVTCPSKPSTQDAILGTGVLAANPLFCAAINRHVLADPADWRNPAAFYKAEPHNWYAKFLHTQAVDGKAYGFCYDDVAEQASFFSGKGNEVVVTLRWD
jgi:hypothetical protein